MKRAWLVLCSISVAPMFIARVASAADVNADPSSYLAAFAGLQPGDRLILAAGTYTGCLVIAGHHGSEGAPTIITGPESGAPAIFDATSCSNGNRFTSATIQLRNSSYIVLRHLELDGKGLAIDGVEADYDFTPTHHITIESLHIHDHDFDSGVNAISTKAPVWDWVIRNNRLINNGLGLYLGDSDGSAPFIRGTIEHNLIRDPKGYGMQIKHQNPRPTVAGLPADGGVTLIRHNVFMKSARGVTGGDERPNLLVGHFPLSGSGLNDRYEVYGNFFYQNDTNLEPLFQGEGNVAFHDNIVVNGFAGTGVWIRPHNDVPKEVAVYRNTVLTSGIGIQVNGGDPTASQVVIGNAVYSDLDQPIIADDASDNLTGDWTGAQSVFNDITLALGTLDLFPRAGQLLGASVDYAAFSAHADFDRDFNGAPIDPTRRGAYAGEGANSGWMLAAEIKPSGMPMMPMPDAGADDAMGGPDGGVQDVGSNPSDAASGLDTSAGADSGAASADSGGGQSDAGAAEVGGTGTDDDGGCGCDASRRSRSSSSSALWIVAALGVLGARRRALSSGDRV